MNSLNYRTIKKSHRICEDRVLDLQSRLDKWLQDHQDDNIISIVSLGQCTWDFNLLIVYEEIIE